MSRNRRHNINKSAAPMENNFSDIKQNSLSGLVGGYQDGFNSGITPTINRMDTAQSNLRWTLAFNNRALLTEMYVELGIVQTLIDQPVEDAFRKGFDLTSRQLSHDQLREVLQFMRDTGIVEDIKSTIKWGRLFGGSGLVILTNQPNEKPLNVKGIGKDSPLRFYSADLWELNMQFYTNEPTVDDLPEDKPYMFYGHPMHKSRVLKYKGKEAPSFVRRRMRGWGMTEVERLFRSLNQYIKNQNVIFELLDEAKVDVYSIEGLQAALATVSGTNLIQKRIALGNQLKNYQNALVLDRQDTYSQKQMQFYGLGDMLKQIREGIAADLKMPVTKLWGVSSAGFNSGEDDIENYNSMIETEVRAKCRNIIIEPAKIVCNILFGFIPDDLEIKWESLRMLNAEQEENVKTAKSTRILNAFSSGLISPEEAKKALNKSDAMGIIIDETEDLFDNPQSEIKKDAKT
jgi:phage-related protein (TIGR01555 family)